MKCIKIQKQVKVGKKKETVIERVSNETAYKAVKEGKATYVSKDAWKVYRATGEVK